MCRSTPALSRHDLEDFFSRPPNSAELMGLEVELAAVDPATGDSCRYDGTRGVRELLETASRRRGWSEIRQGADLVGLTRDDGTQISLEPGGAVEYASPATGDVVTLMNTAHDDLRHIADCAAGLGIALVPGANYPFTDMSTVKWAPKPHSQIVRQYLAGIGQGGEWASEVMALTLSTQVTFDYVSAADLSRKLRTQVAASPVATALFVNSPLEAGRPTGLLSQRMRYWTRHDPRRTGVLTPALDESFTVADFVDWALELPMIYRKNRDKEYVPTSKQPFREILAHGFEDGSMPDMLDWQMHLTQIWTDVRLRQTLELRAVDGPPYSSLGAVPAFWTGLSYDASACADAWALLSTYSASDHRSLMDDVAVRGIRAHLGAEPVSELAAELLRLSRRGLTARVRQQLEHPSVVEYLDPLEEVVATGTTFAEHGLRRWETEFARDPAKYVRAYRIPVD